MLAKVQDYCQGKGLAMDLAARPPKREQPVKVAAPTGTRAVAFDLFRDQAAIEDVMHQTGRTRATTMDYLADFIRLEKVDDISAWVPRELYDQIAAVARKEGTDRLKPIFIGLGEKVPYDVIRLVVGAFESVDLGERFTSGKSIGDVWLRSIRGRVRAFGPTPMHRRTFRWRQYAASRAASASAFVRGRSFCSALTHMVRRIRKATSTCW